MSNYNAKRLGSYGQSKYVIGLGRNRCAAGSITREYNYLERTSQTPFCSLFNFNCPSKSTVPSAPIINGVTSFETSIDIDFSQPSDGGSPIINYEYAFTNVIGDLVYIPFSPPITITPAILTGLTRGTTYSLKIRAVNAIGPSNGSTTITQTTLDVPSAPTNLTGIPSDGSIQVVFDQSSTGGTPITNYEYSLNGGSSWTEFSPAITSSPVTISGLTNGTIYDIKLRAINSVGNSADSSQISIAPIPSNSFAPDDISGINLWLDGQYSSSIITSSNLVTQWNDKSGSSNNFTAGPSGTITYAEPSGINDRPAIYFETSNSYLDRTFNIAPANELSLFMVVYHVSNGVGNSELFFTRSGPTSPGYAYFDLFSNTNTVAGLLSINIGNQTQVSTGVDIRGTIALIDVIATSTVDIYVNGTQTNNNIPRGLLSLDNNLGWAISGGAFIGYMGEIITYPSGVTDTQRQQIEGYLAWKWGIQDNLPDSQPYKNAPPISLDAPVITGTTGLSESVSVDFTQTTGGLTITNYQYSTDNGATFRPLSTPDIISPLIISTLSSDGTTSLTNGVTYEIIIQAKTANGLSPVSNMVEGTPIQQPIVELFTTVGSTSWTAPENVSSVEYLVVAGGGGSGGGYDTGGGGGGGAGMVLTGTLLVTPGTIYDVTVGDGGNGGISDRENPPAETNGDSGENSVFATITALGGGGGYGSRLNSGISSSGGTSISGSNASTGGSGGGSAGDGNGAGGGGGGNTTNGDNGVANTGGNGGLGIANSITGTSVTYGSGGRGANGNSTNNAVVGTANTGNGARGGGGASFAERNGAKGGSGIVVIKYTPSS